MIKKATLITNHWYPGVKWIDFQFNQIMQFVAHGYISNLSFKDDVNLKYREETLEGSESLLKTYQFNLVDSLMNICEKWPKAYVTDKISYCFIADQELSEVGYRNNESASPKGNCYANYLLTFKPELALEAGKLAAFSVLEVFESMFEKYSQGQVNVPAIKWVNDKDIYFDGKKISEVSSKYELIGEKCCLIIGVEVYINLAPEIDGIKTISMKEQLDYDSFDVVEFIDQLTLKLMNNSKMLQSDGIQVFKE